MVPIGWEAARRDGMSGTAGNPPTRDPNDVSVGIAIIMGYFTLYYEPTELM